jgi:hypothetical protein
MRSTVRVTLAGAALAALLALAACGGSSGDAGGTAPSPPAAEPPAPAVTTGAKGPESAITTEAELEPGLPENIAGYQSWIVLNAAPIPPNEQGDAHLGTKNVYTSEPAGPDGVYPDGAIIVKDATRPDADFVGLVAIMQKSAGSDPEHADYASFADFADPDGNTWVLQEVRKLEPQA